MKFSELNPMLGQSERGHQLVMTCPTCKQRFPIDVSLDGEPKGNATWGIKFPETGYSWDDVTIVPSIQGHPQPRNIQKCPNHMSIIKGVIYP